MKENSLTIAEASANTTEKRRILDINGFFGILSVACAVSGWVFSPLSLAAVFIGFYALTRRNKIDSVLGIAGIVIGLIVLMNVAYYQNLDYDPPQATFKVSLSRALYPKVKTKKE